MVWCSGHRCAHRLPDWYTRKVSSLEAVHIDSQVVWSDPLAMERVDPTDLAEVVSCRLGVKLVLRERLLTR
jgi:hypothetical protein